MANYAGGVWAVCPYYLHEALYSISCEGPDGCKNMKMCFYTQAEKVSWLKEKCSLYDYELHCPLAMALVIYDAKAIDT